MTKSICPHKIVKGGKLQKSESSPIRIIIAEGSTYALPVSTSSLAHFCIPLSSLLAQQECPSLVSDQWHSVAGHRILLFGCHQVNVQAYLLSSSLEKTSPYRQWFILEKRLLVESPSIKYSLWNCSSCYQFWLKSMWTLHLVRHTPVRSLHPLCQQVWFPLQTKPMVQSDFLCRWKSAAWPELVWSFKILN